MRVLITVVVLAALGAAVGFSGQSGAQPPQAIVQRQDAAIRAVLRSKDTGRDWGRSLSVFPSHAGSRRCVIPGGMFGSHYAGVCSTRVTLESNGSALVGFVERWSKKSFHAEMGMIRYGKGCNGLPARPSLKLSFAYEFRVTPNGHARLTCQYGDFPPQFTM
jgi:hypothetical protein